MVSPPLCLAQVEVFGVSFDLSPMAACPVGRTWHGDVFPGTILNMKFLFSGIFVLCPSSLELYFQFAKAE